MLAVLKTFQNLTCYDGRSRSTGHMFVLKCHCLDTQQHVLKLCR